MVIGELDLDVNLGFACLAENQLRCESCAQVSLHGKAHAGDGFENRALSRRLVTDHNDLGEIDDLANLKLAKAVDGIEQGLLLCRVQLAQNRRVQSYISHEGREGCLRSDLC